MICKILSAIMILTSVTAISVSADEAVPTTSTVLVNGNNIKFDSYNINETTILNFVIWHMF